MIKYKTCTKKPFQDYVHFNTYIYQVNPYFFTNPMLQNPNNQYYKNMYKKTSLILQHIHQGCI